MRIFSWNVNGVRAAARGGLVPWLQREKPDVVCLQETKAHVEQLEPELSQPSGYHAQWHSAERRGYSGVATFSLEPPLVVQEGLGVPEIDAEGRVLITEHVDVTVVNAYFPNSRHGGGRLWYKLLFLRHLRTWLRDRRAADKPALVCGDFNIAHREIDLANPKTNKANPGFLPEERAWLDAFTSDGYFDAFRRLHPDEVSYTWWSYRGDVRNRNVGWRIDQFWLDERLAPRLESVVHQADVRGSDHCPVGIELR